MAKRTVTILIDDLDGTESDDVASVLFAWDGRSYSVDLTSKNAEKFEKALRPYLDVATRVSGGTPRASNNSGRKGDRTDLEEIRSWASQNGYTVGNRGRIKADVLAAYDSAH